MMFNTKAVVVFLLGCANIAVAEELSFLQQTQRALLGPNFNLCHPCDCFTCGNVEEKSDGTINIAINHCRVNRNVNWICCTELDGEAGACNVAEEVQGCYSYDEPVHLCNYMGPNGEFKINVPNNSTSFQINTHDWRTANVNGDLNNQAICGGPDPSEFGLGGYWCKDEEDGVSTHCLKTFNIKDDCGYEPPEDPWGWGDPHFRTWHNKEFEYHGECDLVLLKAPALDLDVHIRTTIRYDYSFISQAAVRVGGEVFEVASWGEYQLDGMATVDLPAFIGGYPITGDVISGDVIKDDGRVIPGNKHTEFRIHIDQDKDIKIVSFKDYVSVKIENGTQAMFHGSTGLMGDYKTGNMLARNGTLLEDPELYAPEWQVRPEEDGILFAGSRYPEYPEQCVKPSALAIHAARRLGESAVSREDAEAACAFWKEERESCIQDVLKTGDLDMALMV